MESYVVHGFRAENIPGYNCSIRTAEEWHSKTTTNVLLGIGYLVGGGITEVLYAFVMCSLWRMKKKSTCYLIMFLLGIFDMLSISVNSLLTGILWLLGGNYCTAPDLVYIAGSFAVALWGGACLCCLLLVLNRILDLWNPYYTEKFFGPKYIYPWLSVPICYFLYFFLFTRPVLFSSLLGSWLFSPMIQETTEELIEFANLSHIVNNLGVVAVTAIFYVVLLFILGYKFGIYQLQTIERIRRMILVQAILICSASFVGSIIYVYMQFFIIPSWIILTAHFCWQVSNGIPAYVYLAFNPSIRKDIFKVIKPSRVFTPWTLSQQGLGPNNLV